MSYTRSTRHERCITSRSKHKPIFSKNFFSSTIIEWNNLDPGLRKSVNLSVSKTYIFSASYGHLQISFLIATTLKEFVRIKFKRAQIQIEYKIQQINLWSCESDVYLIDRSYFIDRWERTTGDSHGRQTSKTHEQTQK